MKFIEHMTFRLPSDLKASVETIAAGRGITPSKYVCLAVEEAINRERRLYESLSKAFSDGYGIPGIPVDDDDDL